MAIEIVDFPSKNGDFPYVKLPYRVNVGIISLVGHIYVAICGIDLSMVRLDVKTDFPNWIMFMLGYIYKGYLGIFVGGKGCLFGIAFFVSGVLPSSKLYHTPCQMEGWKISFHEIDRLY